MFGVFVLHVHPMVSFCLSEAIILKSFFSCAFGERESFGVCTYEKWLFPFVVESNVATDCKIANSKCHEGILE